MAQTLIRAGWVVTMDPRLGDIKDGCVLVDGETIVAVGAKLAAMVTRTGPRAWAWPWRRATSWP